MTVSKPLPWPFVLILFAIGLAESAYLITELARPLLAKPEPVVTWEPVTDPRFIIPERFRGWVMQYAAEFGIPLDVATRLGYEESWWNPGAFNRNRNGTYDHGLYQLNSAYHRVQTVQSNIRKGLQFLRYCWDRAGTLRGAITLYNAGPNRLYPPLKSIIFGQTVTRGQL